jgi:hypothetical protein
MRARSTSNRRGTTTMIVGAHFLDIGGQLFQAFGIIDLRAQPIGRNCPPECS